MSRTERNRNVAHAWARVVHRDPDPIGDAPAIYTLHSEVLTFGTNSNQNDVAPDVVIGSVFIDLPKAFLLVAREVQGGQFKGRVFNLGVRQDVVAFIPNPAMSARIPAAALAASDSVHQLLRAGTFRALDALLQGSDAAKPITP